MTGQDQIIALRRRGLSPVVVWVSDYPCISAGDGTTVSLSPGDNPELQDWRFLVGLTALIDGYDQNRVERIAKACGTFAKRVITTTFAERKNRWGQPVGEAVKLTDTQGVFVWQS